MPTDEERARFYLLPYNTMPLSPVIGIPRRTFYPSHLYKATLAECKNATLLEEAKENSALALTCVSPKQ